MRVIPDNAQHIGARSEQQDAFGFSDLEDASFVVHAGALAVVADGMGGLAQGREVSQLASRTMIQAYGAKHPARETIPEALLRALREANAAVNARARQLGLEGNTGTTLIAAVVHEGMLYWIGAGDSRIYLYRQGTLTQLTTDHAYGRFLAHEVAAGRLSRAEAAAHPERNALTSFLGLDAVPEIDRSLRPFPLQPGDRVLLCSDGVYGTLSDEELAGLLSRHPAGAAQAVIDAVLARARPHQDNATVALLGSVPAPATVNGQHAGAAPERSPGPPAPPSSDTFLPSTVSVPARGDGARGAPGQQPAVPGTAGHRPRRSSLVLGLAVLFAFLLGGSAVLLARRYPEPLRRLFERVTGEGAGDEAPRKAPENALPDAPTPRQAPRGTPADTATSLRRPAGEAEAVLWPGPDAGLQDPLREEGRPGGAAEAALGRAAPGARRARP